MRANNPKVRILGGTAAGLGLLLAACGPIAFQDTVNLGGPPKPEPPPVAVETKPKRAQLSGDQIIISEKIQFDYNSAVIKPESHSLLDEVVEVLNENADITKLEIIGHTSSEGKASHNLKLSKDRAASVVAYLVEHGIDAGRLKSDGKGPNEPIADNDTEEGKEANRRVEFKVVERAAGARGRPGANK